MKLQSESYGIVIHGGTEELSKAFIPQKLQIECLDAMSQALNEGYRVLNNGGTSLDATKKSIRILEDAPQFNAGKGAVFTHDGKNELDAAIMNGLTLEVGAVAGIKRIKNPIELAHLVLEISPYVLLSSDGAEKFAERNGIVLVDESYFYTDNRWSQLQRIQKRERDRARRKTDNKISVNENENENHGTVGAVALDIHGNLAAGTSSGGIVNRLCGRISDAAIIGAGTYANNNTCAVSTTGYGEYFIRGVSAYDLSAMLEYRSMPIGDAANLVVLEKLVKLGGSGGLIAIDNRGNTAMPFNTPGMYRGIKLSNGKANLDIWK